MRKIGKLRRCKARQVGFTVSIGVLTSACKAPRITLQVHAQKQILTQGRAHKCRILLAREIRYTYLYISLKIKCIYPLLHNIRLKCSSNLATTDKFWTVLVFNWHILDNGAWWLLPLATGTREWHDAAKQIKKRGRDFKLRRWFNPEEAICHPKSYGTDAFKAEFYSPVAEINWTSSELFPWSQ